MLLCLLHGQSIAQKPGDVRWTRLTDLSPDYDTIHSIKVQSDGKIVAAGSTGSTYHGGFVAIAIGRYDEGMLDSSFGINGMVITSLDSAHVLANDVGIQQDGKIVVAGGYIKGTSGDFLLVRYNEDGSIDSSFGVNGIVRTDVDAGLIDIATALAIQTDGKIVTAGRSGSMLATCRYNTDGSLDTSFGLHGKIAFTVGGATCMKLQADGKIVVCCGDVVIRLQPDGSQDYSFGTNAVTALNGRFYGMAIQNDGKILVAGGSSSALALERLDTAGIPDNSFGNGGIVKASGFLPGSSYDVQVATWVSLQTDGRVIAGGWALSCALGDCRPFVLARYQNNGAPDSSFGKYGRVFTGYPYFETANSFSAVINNNGELVVAGTNNHSFSPPSTWALACYYLGPTLAIEEMAHSGRGQIIVAPNPAEDFARIQSKQIENGTWHLSLCDLTGRTLYSEMVAVTNNAFDKSISLIGLPVAMYLVKLDNGVSRMTVRLTKSR